MVLVPDVSSAETPNDFGVDAAALAQRWISELNLAEKNHAAWRTRARKIIRRYRDDQNEASTDVKQRRFSLLWSNMETLGPAVYARTPTAVVLRRYKDADPVGRAASEVLERALNFSLDQLDFAGVMLGVRQDFLLVARGQAWVRYVPHMVAAQGAEGAEPYDVVGWEEAVVDHIGGDLLDAALLHQRGDLRAVDALGLAGEAEEAGEAVEAHPGARIIGGEHVAKVEGVVGVAVEIGPARQAGGGR
jgi:hypothetical protein